jgi:hypothetical protein
LSEDLKNIEIDGGIGNPSEVASSFVLINGRKRYWRETTSLVRNAQREILRIIDENGLKTMFVTDLFDELRKSAKRGVVVKIISEVTQNNYREAEQCAKYFEFRHLQGLVLRFIDVDSTEVILCGILHPAQSGSSIDEQAKFLRFSDARFGEAMKFFFDETWRLAQPLDSILTALSSSRKKIA